MRPLVYYPDDGLRAKTSPLPDFDAATGELADEMVDTMHAANGIGLAGPQIGELRRIFVVHVAGDTPRVFVNPELIAVSPHTTQMEEGCLSIPGVYADVVRPAEITVEAQDAAGKSFRLDASGLLARVVLHELDHLNGMLFIDYLSRFRRTRLLRSYAAPDGAARADQR